MTIGLIGFGRFGRLAARYIARRTAVLVYDHRRVPTGARSGRIRSRTLPEVASQKVVVLAVPISHLPSVLKSIAPHLQPGALVIDVCTVKVRPISWMKKILPRSVYILGSHPMFGPDSDKGSLTGQQVVLTPVRLPDALLRRVTGVLRREGIRVEIMSAHRHDRMIAGTILLTHYIGRLIAGAGLPRSASGTTSYKHLLSVVDVAMNDTLQLLRDIWLYNPYTPRLIRSLDRSGRNLSRILR